MATVIETEGAVRRDDFGDVSVPSDPAAERAAVRKAAVRLLPFLFFLYLIAYLDRVNVGFAKLEMNELPWFSEAVFGTGSGIFFIGYFLFEVPSNLLMRKIGARRWIARIMVSWGIVAMAMLFANSVPTFYALRFTLGIAEAGFYPGVLLYLTYWFTPRQRGRVVALFMTANSVAFILGGPLSGWLMKMPPIFPGLSGWQQMFLLEGLPAVVMGFVVLACLPDGPRQAPWLTAQESEHVVAHVERGGGLGANPTEDEKHASLWAQLGRPEIALLCATFFFLVAGMYGISMWLPQIIASMGAKDDPLRVGLLTAIPYTAAGIVMVANGFHSDRTGERKWHIAVPAAVGALGLVASALFSHSPALSLAALSIAASGMWATLGPFWALPARALAARGGVALAGGIALVNAVGNLGGFLGPFAVGKVQEATAGAAEEMNFAASLIVLAASVTAGGLLALVAARKVEEL
ncbi:MAG: MFS transporter [Fibrella sp.]|nr:MFS transporter [Armatimonadota bacterium]